MIRKIDWLLPHASKLRQYFPWGEAVCSPRFNAAGIEGLQFALYPNGYGSNITEGFCSLFLYGPAGATLHCFLTLGPEAAQTREIQHVFEEAGTYGRTNFCFFEKVIDLVDDSVLVTLEIEDAQQDMITPWAHKETLAGGGTARDLQSVLKLTRNPGKGANSGPNPKTGKLDQVMQLPSIWTPKAFVESENQSNADVPAGFHTFDEVLSRRPLPVRPDSGNKKRTALPAVRGMRKNESAPALKEPAARTAPQQDPYSRAIQEMSSPAPSSAPGAAREDWQPGLPGGASSLGQSLKASRRQRPSSAAGRPPAGVAR